MARRALRALRATFLLSHAAQKVISLIIQGNGEIDGNRLVNMHFLILQGISIRLMDKLAWEKIETHKTLSHGLCGPYDGQLTPQAPKSAVIYILDHGIGAQIWT